MGGCLEDHLANKQECELGLPCPAQAHGDSSWSLPAPGSCADVCTLCPWRTLCAIGFNLVIVIIYSQQGREQQRTGEPSASTREPKGRSVAAAREEGDGRGRVAKRKGNPAGEAQRPTRAGRERECALPLAPRDARLPSVR